MQDWFVDAKLGIFIHWGIYSVKGVRESWSFFNGQISHDDYMAQLSGFTADKYDPQYWADLFARAGARYAVLTTKHHDGVALWPTAQNDLNVVEKTPAARDLVAPFCDALREKNLKVGLYFSHLDWNHDDYGQRFNDEPHASKSWPDAEKNEGWQRFLAFQRAQLQELSTRYHPDLLWFDGDWVPDEPFWNMKQLREQLHRWNPQGVILNARMHGYGDYKTPEQGVPIARPEGAWEFCVTMNDNWGWQPQDNNYKSTRQIVRLFCECIGMGGNLLLDIGPRADGTIPPEQIERLEQLGDWTKKHSEAIYDTQAGISSAHFLGSSTLSKDRKTLYLFFFDIPRDEIAVKGVRNKVLSATVVGSNEELAFRKIGGAEWANVPGVLWIEVPHRVLDANATVIKLELDGELDLYDGAGQAISVN